MKNSNYLYIDLLLLIEGIQVPLNSAQLSYGVGQTPACTIQLVAHRTLRDLPEGTRMALFVLDPVSGTSTISANQNDRYWRLLFDGELAGMAYDVNAGGSTVSLTFMHASGDLDQLTISQLPVASYFQDLEGKAIGQATMLNAWGQHTHETQIFNWLSEQATIAGGPIKTMADLVYLLYNSILVNTSSNGKSAQGNYYYTKMSDTPGGTKMPSRFWNVSNTTKALPGITTVLPNDYESKISIDATYKSNVSTSNTAGSTASKKSSDNNIYGSDVLGKDHSSETCYIVDWQAYIGDDGKKYNFCSVESNADVNGGSGGPAVASVECSEGITSKMTLNTRRAVKYTCYEIARNLKCLGNAKSRIYITSTTGGHSDTRSNHNEGLAVDIQLSEWAQQQDWNAPTVRDVFTIAIKCGWGFVDCAKHGTGVHVHMSVPPLVQNISSTHDNGREEILSAEMVSRIKPSARVRQEALNAST